MDEGPPREFGVRGEKRLPADRHARAAVRARGRVHRRRLFATRSSTVFRAAAIIAFQKILGEVVQELLVPFREFLLVSIGGSQSHTRQPREAFLNTLTVGDDTPADRSGFATSCS